MKHATWPGLDWYFPTAHAAQAVLLPVAFEACPTEQSRQPKLPLELLYVPLGHFRQVACPVSV